jgi:hypothetical protein
VKPRVTSGSPFWGPVCRRADRDSSLCLTSDHRFDIGSVCGQRSMSRGGLVAVFYSSSRTHSATLCSGIDRNILASADLALHIALTFSSGIRPSAGGVSRTSNPVKNKTARFTRTLIQSGPTRRTYWWVSRFQKDMGMLDRRAKSAILEILRLGRSLCRSTQHREIPF